MRVYATPRSPASVRRKKKCLFAEDNKLNRRLLTRLLVEDGWEVVAVRDGQECVEQLAGDFDVVVLDVDMVRCCVVDIVCVCHVSRACVTAKAFRPGRRT
jgi:CheY-like chemotaxis protein